MKLKGLPLKFSSAKRECAVLEQQETRVAIDTPNETSIDDSLHDYDWLDEENGTTDEYLSKGELATLFNKSNSPKMSVMKRVVLTLAIWIIVSLPALITFSLESAQPWLENNAFANAYLWSVYLSINWFIVSASYWGIKLAISLCNWIGFGTVGRFMETIRDYLKEINFWTLFALASFSLAVSFYVMFPVNTTPWMGVASQVLWCICIFAFFMFMHKAFIQYIAITFHKTAYSERQGYLQQGIEILKNLEPAAAKGAQAIERMEKSEISKISTLGKRVRGASDKSWLKELAIPKTSQKKARILARRLFVGLTFPSISELIQLEAFEPYFDTKEEAQKAFTFFDQDGTGDISRDDMKLTVVNLSAEKKALSKALRDLDQVVSTVDTLMLVMTITCSLIGSALIFGANILNIFIPVGSLLLALSFSFGQSVREVFESLIFLFVTHPYDTGDRVYIDDVHYIVKEIRALTTVFVRYDGQMTYMLNFYLKTVPINNVRRSGGMAEAILFQIDFYTPTTKLSALRIKILEFLREHSRDYYPEMDITIVDIELNSKINLSFWLEHKKNWQDMGLRVSRRNKFMYFLKDAMTSLDIRYYPPRQPVTINLEDSLKKLLCTSQQE